MRAEQTRNPCVRAAPATHFLVVPKKGFLQRRAENVRPGCRAPLLHRPGSDWAKIQMTSLLSGSDVNFRHKQAQNRREIPPSKRRLSPSPLPC